jgi:hypothetical protein
MALEGEGADYSLEDKLDEGKQEGGGSPGDHLADPISATTAPLARTPSKGYRQGETQGSSRWVWAFRGRPCDI